ncbi:MAG: CDP-diacylglycerol--glycerol-3-phosphate 3-phosphatidyltransferase [Lachnospirales bacterium]
MNLPNKLTILRVILIPVFLCVLLIDFGIDKNIQRYIALAIFLISSFTDFLDGYIARKYNLVTNFGKFMDPLADKLLVSSAMIALIGLEGQIVALPSIVVIIIIAREFIITGFRTIAVEKNIVIAAGFWGKLKTVFQMAMIVALLLNIDNEIVIIITKALIIISVILAVISATDYIFRNKEVLK